MSNIVDKGISGLHNLGNTCFMNSALQCFSHMDELDKYFNKKYIKNEQDSELINEWIELKEILWKENCVVAPKKFLFNIHKLAKKKNRDIFTGYAQNDLPEFVMFMIESFHDAMKRPVEMNIKGKSINDTDNIAINAYSTIKTLYEKEYSEILNTFYGINITRIYEMNTNNIIKIISEPYFIIHLPIPEIEKINIYDCFDLFINKEKMIDDNKWYNDKTKTYEEIEKDMVFFNFPDVICINFKRFDNQLRKNNSVIDYPLDNLNLSKYVDGYNKDDYKYELFAVCNHSGTIMGGHYTSFIRPKLSEKWYHFNDNKIQLINENNIVTRMSYCLFYRKKKI
jgi:ubiquitin C-terminal hydrolase